MAKNAGADAAKQLKSLGGVMKVSQVRQEAYHFRSQLD